MRLIAFVLLILCFSFLGFIGMVMIVYAIKCIRIGRHFERFPRRTPGEWVLKAEQPVQFQSYMAVLLMGAVMFISLSLLCLLRLWEFHSTRLAYKSAISGNRSTPIPANRPSPSFPGPQIKQP
jgi:hypothetical protein